MDLKGTIEKIVKYAILVTVPDEIILFGSVAAGTSNVYSDVDLLIITESGVKKKEAVANIKNIASQYSLKTDVLIYSQVELKTEISIPNSFIKAIQKSGKCVYKKCL